MIFAAIPRPATLPPLGGPRGLACVSRGGTTEAVSVREGGGAMAAPEAIEEQSPSVSLALFPKRPKALSALPFQANM